MNKIFVCTLLCAVMQNSYDGRGIGSEKKYVWYV